MDWLRGGSRMRFKSRGAAEKAGIAIDTAKRLDG
jgi:hypothetical protein